MNHLSLLYDTFISMLALVPYQTLITLLLVNNWYDTCKWAIYKQPNDHTG